MFGSFQASTGPILGAEGVSGKSKEGGSRRISTSNACLECRRRKIRCDGNQPCSQCQWYHHPEACKYTKPTQRVVPSRALVEKLTTRNSQNESVFQRMFPGRDVESLVSLSREELLNLALTLPASSPPATNHTSAPDSVVAGSDAANSLEALEQAPDQDPEIDETKRHFDTNVQRVSDDVNGLSLNVDKQSSYVGASSITAALKVIFRVAPGARLFLAHGRPIETALPSRANTPPQYDDASDGFALPSPEDGRIILEAYFTHIHCLMPAVDEQQVWTLYNAGTRQDAPWLALLNTVLALGCLAAFSAESDQHTVFFTRAMHHINVELLGSGNIMVVQALGLLAGYYLHYLSRPNLANNLMGAALRMELALGMHRDFTHGSPAEKSADSQETGAAEQRRRTWWTIYNLDTWAGFTTGRPTMGRSGPGVTVRVPRVAMEKMDSAKYQDALKMLPLIHNTTLSKIATRIQDAMAVSHALDFEDILSFDAEIVAWYDDLPSILLPLYQRQGSGSPDLKRRTSSATSKKPLKSPLLKGDKESDTFDFSAPLERTRSTDGCPLFLRTSRIVMHYRYQNLRIVLHRPAVLAAALRRVPFSSLSPEEKVAVGRCRAVAAQTIADIDSMTEEEHIVGWTGTWFMYNAVMVPLVSLFSYLSLTAAKTRQNQVKAESSPQPVSHPSPGTESEVDKWKTQIETAISFLNRMIPWCSTAKKSHDVVKRLYEASERFSYYNKTQREQLYAQTPSVPQSPAAQAQAQREYQSQLFSAQQQQQSTPLANGFHAPQPTAPTSNGFMTSFPPSYPPTSLPPFPPTAPQNPNHIGPAFDNSMFQAIAMQQQAFNDPHFWTLQTPAADVSLDMFWQEMQWDTVPIFDGDEFNEYNPVELPGSVAVDMHMEGGYFGDLPMGQGGPPGQGGGGANGMNGGGNGVQGGGVGPGTGKGVASWDYGAFAGGALRGRGRGGEAVEEVDGAAWIFDWVEGCGWVGLTRSAGEQRGWWQGRHSEMTALRQPGYTWTGSIRCEVDDVPHDDIRH